MKKLGSYLVAWWKLSRVPFLSVGILPLILGYVLAWRRGYDGPLGLYVLSTAAVILIMWMTYYLGEWNDLEGDRLNRNFSPFSGGSRILVEGVVPPWVSLLLGYGCFVGAIFVGLYIYFQYRTGPWTLLLGGIGIFFGFFYSNKPFRWSHRGLGEALIGFCYGWLPIATGFYLFAGFFSSWILLVSIPISLSVFNVILINEFPDEDADRAVGKKTLVVRFGKERIGDLYMGCSILTAFSFIKSILVSGQTPFWLFLLSGIPILLILWNLVQILQGGFYQSERLGILCRNTLLVNLSVGMILTIQQTLIELH
ncbi:MAG TPA: prenyltransferase [Thermodesulfobacteriota bacterium]|nr:prenyltransferase [Thermodesulfobacteriota bacterium]